MMLDRNGRMLECIQLHKNLVIRHAQSLPKRKPVQLGQLSNAGRIAVILRETCSSTDITASEKYETWSTLCTLCGLVCLLLYGSSPYSHQITGAIQVLPMAKRHRLLRIFRTHTSWKTSERDVIVGGLRLRTVGTFFDTYYSTLAWLGRTTICYPP